MKINMKKYLKTKKDVEQITMLLRNHFKLINKINSIREGIKEKNDPVVYANLSDAFDIVDSDLKEQKLTDNVAEFMMVLMGDIEEKMKEKLSEEKSKQKIKKYNFKKLFEIGGVEDEEKNNDKSQIYMG